MAGKKYWVAGGVGLVGIFVFLMTLGLTITSDGDKACAGTLLDPCVSYITVHNPTPNTIYVREGQPMDAVFQYSNIHTSDSPIAKYSIFTKYNGKWRLVDFTNKTKFGMLPAGAVFAFRPLRDTEFKLVGYKKNPKDVVKWTFGNNQLLLDPVWNQSDVWTQNYPSLDPNASVYTTSELSCSIVANISEYTLNYTNGTGYYVKFGYFNNNVLIDEYTSTEYVNETPEIVYPSYNVTEALVPGDIWHCRVKVYSDASIDLNFTQSDILISNYIEVLNIEPNITTIYPTNLSVVDYSENYSLILSWVDTDPDPEETTYYEFYEMANGEPDFTLFQNSSYTDVEVADVGHHFGESLFNTTWYDANTSNYCKGIYGGRDTEGFTNISAPLLYDDNDTTGAYGGNDPSYFYINYSKPNSALGAKWNYVAGFERSYECWNGTGWADLTVFSDSGSIELSPNCFAVNPIKIKVTLPLLLGGGEDSNKFYEESITWLNMTPGMEWCVKAYDSNGGSYETGSAYFNVSFLNWSISYSPNVSSLMFKPTGSVGIYYAQNQSDSYGVFTVINNGDSTISLAVNNSKPLTKWITPYFYKTGRENSTKANNSAYAGTGWSNPINFADGIWTSYASYGGSEYPAISVYSMNFTEPQHSCGIAYALIKLDVENVTRYELPTSCYNRSEELSRQIVKLDLYEPVGCLYCSSPLTFRCINKTGGGVELADIEAYKSSLYETGIDFGTCGRDNETVTYTQTNYSEPYRNYTRFNDSTTSKQFNFTTESTQNTSLQKMYKYVNFTSITFDFDTALNTSNLSNANVKLYLGDSLVTTVVPIDDLSLSSYPNFSMKDNATFNACTIGTGTGAGLGGTFNVVNFTNVTLNLCNGKPFMINATRIYFNNVWINGSQKGSSGGAGGVKGTCSSGSCGGKGGKGGNSSNGELQILGGTAGGGSTVWRSTISCTGGGGAGGAPGSFLGYKACGGNGTAGSAGGTSVAGGSNGCSETQMTVNTTFYDIPRLGGGAGGGGGGGVQVSGSCGGASGTSGGRGGGAIRIYSFYMEMVNVNITLNGGRGGTGGYPDRSPTTYPGGGGGGGSGGTGGEGIFIATGVVNMSNVKLESVGGDGGFGYRADGDVYYLAHGQPGSGGRIKIYYVSLGNLTISVNTSAGPPNYTVQQVLNGSYYLSPDSALLRLTKTINPTTTINTYLQTCTEVQAGHTCTVPVSLVGTALNATIYNIFGYQDAVTGTTDYVDIMNILPGETRYLWSKALYNNSPTGATFNMTWRATTP